MTPQFLISLIGTLAIPLIVIAGGVWFGGGEWTVYIGIGLLVLWIYVVLKLGADMNSDH